MGFHRTSPGRGAHPGPATVADVATWSRLTGLRQVVERLRPRLWTFRDERGRELFDLPEAPRPDPATPSPPRFLPEYDNVLLSHADRSRFASEERRGAFTNVQGRIHGSVLSDGLAFGVWQRERDGGLVVNYAGRATKRTLATVAAEGRRLLRLIAADADTPDVRLVRIDSRCRARHGGSSPSPPPPTRTRAHRRAHRRERVRT